MNKIDELTVNYIKSLQNYINESKDINYIHKGINDDYLSILDIILNRVKDIEGTCSLEYYNGEQDITEDNLNYYLKEMSKKYGFEILDDKWLYFYIVKYKEHEIRVGVVNPDGDGLFTNINGVNNSFLSIRIDKKHHSPLFSFFQLDQLFDSIKA